MFHGTDDHGNNLHQTSKPSQTSYLQRLYAACREITLISIRQTSKPPGLVLFKQNLDQVSMVQVQFLMPSGPVLDHCHHHLPNPV